MQQPWLGSLLLVLVEGIPPNAHRRHVHSGRLADAGQAAVHARDSLSKCRLSVTIVSIIWQRSEDY